VGGGVWHVTQRCARCEYQGRGQGPGCRNTLDSVPFMVQSGCRGWERCGRGRGSRCRVTQGRARCTYQGRGWSPGCRNTLDSVPFMVQSGCRPGGGNGVEGGVGHGVGTLSDPPTCSGGTLRLAPNPVSNSPICSPPTRSPPEIQPPDSPSYVPFLLATKIFLECLERPRGFLQ
jgi:hypothetical protein